MCRSHSVTKAPRCTGRGVQAVGVQAPWYTGRGLQVASTDARQAALDRFERDAESALCPVAA
jgi:hypothetical protein